MGVSAIQIIWVMSHISNILLRSRRHMPTLDGIWGMLGRHVWQAYINVIATSVTVSGHVDFDFYKSIIINGLRYIYFPMKNIDSYHPPPLTLPFIFNRDISIYFRKDDAVKWKWLQDISDKSLAMFPHLLHQLLLMYLLVNYSWKHGSEAVQIKICKVMFIVQLLNQNIAKQKPQKFELEILYLKPLLT